jgi:hypothetical protein
MPFTGYWQQDIDVKLDATLNDSTNIITGKEYLTYYNNSPDTLHDLYFHLYQNAFQPGSYMDDQYKNNKTSTKYGKYEKAGKGTEILSCSENNVSSKIEYDNTIMRIRLQKPLLPNSEVKVAISFKTYFDNGGVRRRMKMFKHDGVTQYDGVHWYPRVSVYDRKFGWTTDQHLGREFYGDFGSFDVSLTLPSQYILEATGTLLNENEVMPKELREKLDLKNFAIKKPGGMLTEIIKKDGSTKTWKFHVENVHDFAWVADPSFRIGTSEWHGIKIVTLAQEFAAPRWQNSAEYTAKIIETYSTDFGMYGWPKIVVADARDGMEYPMLTLCGGGEPDYRNLIGHEVGHEWFFGMVGNNETYRAMMDEGFTQFLTVWGNNRIDGPYRKEYPPKSWYARKFYKPIPAREQQLYLPYIRSAISGDNTTLNTHSDQFNGAIGHGGGYGMVYYKTGTMLYNLQYVLGDSLFLKAMKHYFYQWKFCHPYPEDFRSSIIQYTHVDLNWFFDEWIETSKTIDYAVERVKKTDTAGKYIITFKRLGRMQMPLDFTVYNKQGKKFSYYIPNTDFQKQTTATILPKWQGWDNVREEYKAEVKIEGKLKDVVIDTSYRIADIDLLNNQKLKFIPGKWQFDSQVISPADRTNFMNYWRPDLWYNSVDGLKIGFHFDGVLFGKGTLSYTAWLSSTNNGEKKYYNPNRTNLGGINVSSMSNLPNGFDIIEDIRSLDGLVLWKLGIYKKLDGQNVTLNCNFKAMARLYPDQLDYLLYPNLWNAGKWNNTVNLGILQTYGGLHGSGSVGLALRSSTLFSDYDYSICDLVWKHTLPIWRFSLRSRWIAEYSTGSSIAPESQLYLAGANPEDMMENKFVRSRGFVPEQWLGYGNNTNHFQQGGGLNLRGYSGYVAPTFKDSNQKNTFAGTAGTAINLELDFDRIVKFQPKLISRFFSLNTYLFMDAGTINYNGLEKGLKLTDIKMDAGIGAALTIKSWGVFQKVHPFTIRFDMPLFLNPAPFLDKDNFKFRWVMGVGRSF